jgi:hypothetical protein
MPCLRETEQSPFEKLPLFLRIRAASGCSWCGEHLIPVFAWKVSRSDDKNHHVSTAYGVVDGQNQPRGETVKVACTHVAYGGSKLSGDTLRQDRCFHMGASVPTEEEGAACTYGYCPVSDSGEIDRKPLPQA